MTLEHGVNDVMTMVSNTGKDRILDKLRAEIAQGDRLDVVSRDLSVFAAAELWPEFSSLSRMRILLPQLTLTQPFFDQLHVLGGDADRASRTGLTGALHGQRMAQLLESKAAVRWLPSVPETTLMVVSDKNGRVKCAFNASPFSTSHLGVTPSSSFVQFQVVRDNAAQTSFEHFDRVWHATPETSFGAGSLAERLRSTLGDQTPSTIYHHVLAKIFEGDESQLDEERVLASGTGIKQSLVWNKLYKFQKDGVLGALDKMDKFGGCIIADSVGLGKTFEALAIIKYYELRNSRVLVLCPKRLRENWTLWTLNDERNPLEKDRFNYQVLHHTDLLRDRGMVGDVDLETIRWGNYDLVVIDESHNFRNKKSPRQGKETRYDRLMNTIIKAGVKTRVLMLSATPVNNRLNDLKNQINFATEGNDGALADVGISSIEFTTRRAQSAFKQWSELPEAERTPSALVDRLGYDYFSMLDHLTIARSRRHIEKYYGTGETGAFPRRLKPINVKPDVDLADEFPSIESINHDIRRLLLAAHTPTLYVLPQYVEDYKQRYETRTGSGSSFIQSDREQSLANLLRVNLLKRMESSIYSFTRTLERLHAQIETLLQRIEERDDVEVPVDFHALELEDPEFEEDVVGRSVKVHLSHMDLIRWRQDLREDRGRLEQLLRVARLVTSERDAKLAALKDTIRAKVESPINEGNRKVLVFTAFADTAEYLYESIAEWAQESFGLHVGLITGAKKTQTTLPGLRTDFISMLTAFAPIAKERPARFSDQGEIDLLIATDCISEGQNLQDCDWIINYDIHWNPVRIIQRFGRVDRLGSPNRVIQLVNFWPNIELEAYINLEQIVSGRMVLLDVSATGEENLIQSDSRDPMNDLEYRRKQLLRLQDAAIDLEDIASGISMSDLTLGDFRIDLAEYKSAHHGKTPELPWVSYGVCRSPDVKDVPPGLLVCLKDQRKAPLKRREHEHPMAPYYVMCIGEDGTVLMGYTATKRVLDAFKRVGKHHAHRDETSFTYFARETKSFTDMRPVQSMVNAALTSVIGKAEEKMMDSLFTAGGTSLFDEETPLARDFEVVAYLRVYGMDQQL